MIVISADNRILAKHLRDAFGSAPQVSRYWDANEVTFVDVMVAQDTPERGVASYATLGVSDAATGATVDGMPLRVEIVMAAPAEVEEAANIVSTCAFNVLNDRFAIAPGVIFRDVVRLYRPETRLPHVMFVTPFLWKLETQRLATKTVAWLLAVPISDAENAFATSKGSDRLETIFEERQIDIFDFSRASIV